MMLKHKISLTQALSNRIAELRKANGSKASEIAKCIGKSTGWISLIENRKLSTVNSEDLVKLFSSLLSISNEAAEKYLEEFLDEHKQFRKQEGIVFYDENDESFTEEGFKKITENITSIFEFAYKEKSKFAFNSLGEFMENLKFDLGFIFALNRIPFYKLENTDIEIRKKMFDEISNVAQKYIEEYGKEDIESINSEDH